MPAVLYDKADGIAVVTINRPEKRNAVNPEVACGLVDAWADIANDDGVRVAIVTGAGNEAFCAGADLGRLTTLIHHQREPQDDYDRRVLADQDIVMRGFLKGVDLHKPIIAAAKGYVLAGGCELMLGCDLRVIATNTTVGLTETKRGLIPAGGGVVRLSRAMPKAIATEMLLTGEPITAEQALGYGLVNRVVEPDAVLPTAFELARSIAANGPLAVHGVRTILRDTDGMELADAFKVETKQFAMIQHSYDAVEGPRAFIEKRTPRFEGR